jgi:hypothetical protein
MPRPPSSSNAVNSRLLIPVAVALTFLAIVGVLQGAAKDHPTTVEGLLFWISLVALPFLLIALVILIIAVLRRSVRRTAGGS